MPLPLLKTQALSLLLACMLLLCHAQQALAGKRDFYQLKIYHYATKEQEARLDGFLAKAYLPALHRLGMKAGVFKTIIPEGTPEPTDKLLYVLIPFKSANAFFQLEGKLAKDKQYAEDGKDYLDTPYTQPVYTRIESVLLNAFVDAPVWQMPALTGPKSERVYELRSYEGHSEKIYQNKVEMFNKGDEIGLFKRLHFNAVFYGEVVSGAQMPNLMYMTTFENRADRDAHWKAFSADDYWKKLSARPAYQHNVAKNDTRFLRPAEYSDI